MFCSLVCIVRGYESQENDNVSVPTLTPGLFAPPRPIPCTGTLKTVSGRGVCLSDDSPQDGRIQYSMRLHIARRNPYSRIHETIPNHITTITGDCNDNNGIGEFEKSLDLEVMVEDFIVFEVTECVTEENMRFCPFLPVFETTDVTSCIKYSNDLDFITSQELCGMLAIEAYIRPRKFKLVLSILLL